MESMELYVYHKFHCPVGPGGGGSLCSNTMELRICINKNVEKGLDFGQWASTTFFFQIRGRFLTIRHKGYPLALMMNWRLLRVQFWLITQV